MLSPGDADTWVEEDRQTYGQPRNPYHRVDALPSSRHVQVLAGQAIVADTGRPVLLIETGVAPRWYIPPGDAAWAQLEPDPAAPPASTRARPPTSGAQQRRAALDLPPS